MEAKTIKSLIDQAIDDILKPKNEDACPDFLKLEKDKKVEVIKVENIQLAQKKLEAPSTGSLDESMPAKIS